MTSQPPAVPEPTGTGTGAAGPRPCGLTSCKENAFGAFQLTWNTGDGILSKRQDLCFACAHDKGIEFHGTGDIVALVTLYL